MQRLRKVSAISLLNCRTAAKLMQRYDKRRIYQEANELFYESRYIPRHIFHRMGGILLFY